MDLAEDIAQSGLATRVFVNRVWKWHFGTGIVNTPDNFGKAGDPPSNPELLEYLANYFVQNGMSVKKLQRDDHVVVSVPAVERRLRRRMKRRIRPTGFTGDSIGSGWMPKRCATRFCLRPGHWISRKPAARRLTSPTTTTAARFTARSAGFDMNNFLQVFDFPNPSFTAEQRFSTIVPLQRLYFMNSSFVYKQAEQLARRVYDGGRRSARGFAGRIASFRPRCQAKRKRASDCSSCTDA